MFKRKLKHDERATLATIETLVRQAGGGSPGDPPRALDVLKYATAIGMKVSDSVNPVVLTASALLQQVGSSHSSGGSAGAFLGASLVEVFLRSTNLSDSERVQIVRAVGAVTAPDLCPLESVEEKIVWDAVQIESFGMMGTLCAIRASTASLADTIRAERARRKSSYDKLHYEVSRTVGQPVFRQGDVFIKTVEQAYFASASDLKDLELPF